MAPGWGDKIKITTDKGFEKEVAVGSPFAATINDVAKEANYGMHFRVILNGEEIDPEDAPETVQVGQEIVIRSYDKVG